MTFRFPAFLILTLLVGLIPTRAHGPLHEEITRLTVELNEHPDDPDRLVQRGELFRVHGLYSEALLDWTKVALLRPNDATNDLRLGLIALGQRDTNAALESLTRFTAARPACLPGQLAAAEASRLARRRDEAARHWTAAIALVEEPRPEWFLERARDAQAAPVPVAEVLAGLDEGIARYGPLPALQLLAVDLEVKRGNIEAALARLKAIADRAERKERWLVRQGDVLLAAGRTNEALVEYTAARAALDQLPDKLRRAWVATELRQQIDSRLATRSLNPAGSASAP